MSSTYEQQQNDETHHKHTSMMRKLWPRRVLSSPLTDARDQVVAYMLE